MGWRIPTEFFIAPGATVRIIFWFDGNRNGGPQWAMAHQDPQDHSAPLATERVGKHMECADAIAHHHGYVCDNPENARWSYFADIHNEGVVGCWFYLEGGGV